MAHLVFTGASFKPRTARFLFNLTSLRLAGNFYITSTENFYITSTDNFF